MKYSKAIILKHIILIVFLLSIFTAHAGVKCHSIRSFNFVQKKLDLRKNGDMLFFSLREYSHGDFKKIIVTFNSPSGREKSETSCIINSDYNGALIMGYLKLKKKSESGIWSLGEIVVETITGQFITFNEEYFIEQKNNTKVLIKGKNIR